MNETYEHQSLHTMFETTLPICERGKSLRLGQAIGLGANRRLDGRLDKRKRKPAGTQISQYSLQCNQDLAQMLACARATHLPKKREKEAKV